MTDTPFYPLAHDNWGKEEMQGLARVLARGRYTMGEEVKAFEDAFARQVGARHAVMVNSGSSANLLTIGALVETGRLKRGDEVLVPAVSWSTTYFPLHQYGLRIVFCDVDPATFNIDPAKIAARITPRTRALLAVNLLGNPCDFAALSDICAAHGLILIEDNCESFGARWGLRDCGTMGVAGTFSTFFSHHLNTVEGGLIVTDDDDLHEVLRSMRAHGWVRDLPVGSKLYRRGTDRYAAAFEDSFKFVMPGYCLRPMDMAGAFGLAQLGRWPAENEQRQDNARHFIDLFGNLSWCSIQRVSEPIARSSWFGFGIVLAAGIPRRSVVEALLETGVECRPIVAGNFTRQPVCARLDCDIPADLSGADILDRQGFFIGNDGRRLAPLLCRVRDIIKTTIRSLEIVNAA